MNQPDITRFIPKQEAQAIAATALNRSSFSRHAYNRFLKTYRIPEKTIIGTGNQRWVDQVAQEAALREVLGQI